MKFKTGKYIGQWSFGMVVMFHGGHCDIILDIGPYWVELTIGKESK